MIDDKYGKEEEHCILAPTNPYAATKAGAEMIAGSYKHSYGLPIIISRGNNVFGPGQYPEKLIPRWLGLLRDNKPLEIAGTGEQLRSFLWVDDVSRAFEVILERGVIGEIYNIGSQEEYSVLDVAKIMLAEFGKSGDNIIFIEDRPFNDKRYFINSEKLADLGWQANVGFREGLKQLIAGTC
jgi:UDP-glucose 4,6-dehydratase